MTTKKEALAKLRKHKQAAKKFADLIGTDTFVDSILDDLGRQLDYRFSCDEFTRELCK